MAIKDIEDLKDKGIKMTIKDIAEIVGVSVQELTKLSPSEIMEVWFIHHKKQNETISEKVAKLLNMRKSGIGWATAQNGHKL